MKRIFAIFGYLSITIIIVITVFFTYQFIFPPKAEVGDVIAFNTIVNGPERKVEAYILRGESPNTKLIGQLPLPSEVANSEMKAKFYDGSNGQLFFTNEYGFSIYNIFDGTLVNIKSGSGGYALKRVGNSIWYSIDLGMAETGYQNMLCEYTIDVKENNCVDIDNLQIMDIERNKENIYIAGFKSNKDSITDMIRTLKVLDNEYNEVVDIEFSPNDSPGWTPFIFFDPKDEHELIIKNESIYYNYSDISKTATRENYTNNIIRFDTPEHTYTIYGGQFGDYDKEKQCTRIGDAETNISCKPGYIPVESNIIGNKTVPTNSGLLTVVSGLYGTDNEIEFIQVVDLNTLDVKYKYDILTPRLVNYAIYIE